MQGKGRCGGGEAVREGRKEGGGDGGEEGRRRGGEGYLRPPEASQTGSGGDAGLLWALLGSVGLLGGGLGGGRGGKGQCRWYR